MLALAAMSAGWQAFFFVVAFILLVISGVISALGRAWTFALLALGLAAYVLVFAYNAIAAA